MLKAYKYCLLPTEEQKQQLAKFFGSCRFVFNLGLETKMQAWTTARKHLTCIDLANQMKELKDTEATWLQECPSQTLQMSLRNLDNAYTQFFKGGGFPKFKSKHRKQSIQFPQGVKTDFENSIIFLPKLKNVTCIFHRQFKGEIKTVTVSRTSTGKYFVSILVENQKQLPKKKPVMQKTTVGIDMGVKTFATLSDGTTFDNPKHLRNNLRRLRVEQRKLSRRFKRGAKEQSKNFLKQKLVVAKLHEHIKNQREDYLHKASTHIIRSYNSICLEDLNIKGMMQNEKIALAIGEVGWHKFKTMLEYKAEWYGKNILYIGRFQPSSKLCSHCGHIFKELSLKDRSWTCQSCGTHHERDENAALNIKTFGLRIKPSTVNVSH
ncbi:RNA-guided endonuclease TnpB family protein [Arachidicoccus soli]|jgi:putative transposase|uniref:Transposase n=1 Tax=Arachidicoccus soli TaxID=2341117 RepID=A0A386HQW3_9BACT|nr:RNA-guided endonuclease TnpB family protein [Arachidicoccus soli]AYD46876.1 transposase [Arachidicoccus soli]AYD47966.1 transposase [Arachidicoccus soli]AYD48012.1 transposase [Arachidicoccus soli]AYD48180.1 transposase [Arachidicoccus soli]AYD49284.1 transposase [Arachidicoccus soli]